MTGGVYTKDQRGVCVGGRSKKGRIELIPAGRRTGYRNKSTIAAG
jgi:hypothetical protein